MKLIETNPVLIYPYTNHYVYFTNYKNTCIMQSEEGPVSPLWLGSVSCTDMDYHNMSIKTYVTNGDKVTLQT